MADTQAPASPPKALATGILTLTSTHPGTGQATASVDLPVARDPATGMPVLPATSLKGVARAALEGKVDKDWVKMAFGPEVGGDDNDKLVAGALSFGEGQLLAYPLRALHRPQVFATSPLLLRRWNRLRRAHGLEPWSEVEAALDKANLAREAGKGLHAAMAKARTTVTVVEDVALAKDQILPVPELTALANRLSTLLPDQEKATRTELADGLVLLSDPLLTMILRRALPVQARIKLGAGKTTSDGGNLWYEELLPADCLFGAIIAPRTPADQSVLTQCDEYNRHWRSVQIGGGETVGLGRCLWTVEGGK
jgi:CRISPR-associated protein Cmr4